MLGYLKNNKVKQTDKPLKGFVKLTRVYGQNRKQPIVLSVNEIESFRPRNKIKGNRCTIVTTGGRYVNVAEKFSEVHRLLTRAVS